jgi:hypothetical protein
VSIGIYEALSTEAAIANLELPSSWAIFTVRVWNVVGKWRTILKDLSRVRGLYPSCTDLPSVVWQAGGALASRSFQKGYGLDKSVETSCWFLEAKSMNGRTQRLMLDNDHHGDGKPRKTTSACQHVKLIPCENL